MTMRRCILVVTPWKRRWELGSGAGLADDLYFIEGFAARGFDVHYVCPRDHDPPDLSIPGYHVHYFFNFYESTHWWPTFLKRLLWPGWFTVFASWRAWRAGRRVRPCVVLGQSYVASAAAFLAGLALRVPSAVKLFGVMDLAEPGGSALQQLRRHGEMIAALHVPHDGWIVLDDGTRGADALRAHGVPREQIHFLPNGVNLEWASHAGDPNWLRQRAGISPEKAVVLYMARLVDWKRPDVLVRVAAQVCGRTSRPVAIVVAGDGPERRACEALAASLGVAEHVHFVGPVPHAQIPDVMAAANVFGATSRHSNRSIAVCEALVCGVPAVAFDTGETYTVVRDGDTGRLVVDGDEATMATAIIDMLEDEEARGAAGRRARAFAQANFVGWQARVEGEVDIVEALSRAAP